VTAGSHQQVEGDSSKAVGPGKARQITGAVYNGSWEGEAKGSVYLYIYIHVYYYIHIPIFIHVDIIYLRIKIA
jgi:hypothetical protein